MNKFETNEPNWYRSNDDGKSDYDGYDAVYDENATWNTEQIKINFFFI
ncbi:MAG: hypothetical protein ACXW2E_11375 [Nitrososphaeraceae archaeon]